MPANTPPLRRYWNLILYKTYADLRTESARTYVGFVWWILEPIISMAVYYVVFSVLLQRGGPGYVAFLFTGLVPWRWFQSTIMRGSNSILAERGLMQQVHLPKVVFPVIHLLGDTVKFLVVLLLLLLYLFVAGYPPSPVLLALPLVIVTQFLLIAALTIAVAGAVPFVPDLRIVLQNLLRLLFFLSGVFYDLATFPATWQGLFRLNPMVVVLEAYRSVLLEGSWPDFTALGLVGAVAAVLLVGACGGIFRFDYLYPKLRF